jgi:hypothetical protein
LGVLRPRATGTAGASVTVFAQFGPWPPLISKGLVWLAKVRPTARAAEESKVSSPSQIAYHERLLAAVDRACAASPDGWANAREIALAFEPGPLSINGTSQRLSAARTHGFVICRPGTKGGLQWQRA